MASAANSELHNALQDSDCRSNRRDSGYASQFTVLSDSLGARPTHLSSLGRRFLQPKTTLKRFDVQTPPEVQERFVDLKKLFDVPLYNHLSKSGARPLPVAITLQYLGEDEANTGPWIVVLCDKSVAKQVRQWFNTAAVRSYCRPDDAQLNLPKFHVLVHDRAPRLLAAWASIHRDLRQCPDYETGYSLCGQLFKASDSKHGRMATVGGLLKISWKTRFSLYGITVDHVFDRTSDRCPEPTDERWEGEEDGDDDGDDESDSDALFETNVDAADQDVMVDEDLEVVLDDYYELEIAGLSDDEQDLKILAGSSAAMHDFSCLPFGRTVPMPCHSVCENSLDWRLLDFGDLGVCRSNNMQHQDLQLQPPSSSRSRTGLDKDVWILSGVNGERSGKIAGVPAYLDLGLSYGPVETYVLRLADGSQLSAGDCGAWVVDAVSGEVYAQVVASDALENVYALPFNDILEEIKRTFQAESVTFPTQHELVWSTSLWRRHVSSPVASGLHKHIEEAYGQFPRRRFNAPSVIDQRSSDPGNSVTGIPPADPGTSTDMGFIDRDNSACVSATDRDDDDMPPDSGYVSVNCSPETFPVRLATSGSLDPSASAFPVSSPKIQFPRLCPLKSPAVATPSLITVTRTQDRLVDTDATPDCVGMGHVSHSPRIGAKR